MQEERREKRKGETNNLPQLQFSSVAIQSFVIHPLAFVQREQKALWVFSSIFQLNATQPFPREV